MAAAEEPKPSDTVQALVQLLRTRSAEEIRERMYDNPPGSPWWSACKTELDVRNGEKMATALVDTSRILDKLKSAAEHLDGLTDKLVQTTNDMAEIVKAVKESGRRMELTTYVIVAITIVLALGLGCCLEALNLQKLWLKQASEKTSLKSS